MKRVIFVLLSTLGLLVLVACDTTSTDPDIKVTGIMLSDTVGQGTESDPFTFTLEEGETITSTITVSPQDIIRDLKFTLKKKVGDKFENLSSGDVAGLEFTSNNSNTNLSVKALKEGTHYFTIGQDDLVVYVRINVTKETGEEPEPPTEVDFTKTLKVLAIGNSFSQDGMAYLYQVAESFGVEEIILGNLYIGGAELSLHANNIANASASYAFQKNTSGTWQTEHNKTLKYGLQNKDWDIITIQQASGKSGRPTFYEPHLTNILKFVQENKTNENAKIYWHLTWAYQQDSTHGEFPFYESDQDVMYESIISTYNEQVKTKEDIQGLIPAGTAIQNIRTSFIGDTVTSDGYHLNGTTGRFTAALTWFKAITGLSIDDIEYRPSGVTVEQADAIKESVNHAIEKPLEVTLSTHNEGGSPINLNDHTLLKLNYVIGYYMSTSSYKLYNDAANSVYFTTHDTILSKENLPVGSVLLLEDGYQYRVNFFTALEGPVTDNIRTDNITEAFIEIDEAWWGDFEYVAFNVAHKGNSIDITNSYQEVADKFKIYAAPGAQIPPMPHVDEPLFFVSGYWNDNATRITNNGGSFDLGFAASNVLSKAYFENYTAVTVANGYQVRVIYLTYDGFGGYKVLSRTVNFQGKIDLDETFWGNYEYVAFNISSVPSSDISGILDTLPELLTFSEVEMIEHQDEPLAFELGYWAVDDSSKTDDNHFASTNIVSKAYLDDIITISVVDGYELRAVFFTYDGQGSYVAVDKTDPTTTEFALDSAFWSIHTFVAFEITKTEPADLSVELDSLIDKVNLSEEALVPHVDEPLNFISGYWADFATKVTNNGTSFDLGFAASNVLSKSFFDAYGTITIAPNHQVRVVFLSYDGFGGYKVLHRTANLQGTIELDEAFWSTYEYIAFNISTIPSSNLSELLDTLPSKFTLGEAAEDEGIQYTFVSGYWADNATQITNNGGSFDLGFAASNPLPKDTFTDIDSIEIAAGYQVRFVFFTTQGDGYKVLFRTANITGEVVMDDEFWGSYEYLGFNISTTPSTDLSDQLATLPEKLTFKVLDEVPHIDTDFEYQAGYYADGATSITYGGSTFDKGFAASNIFSKAYVMEYTHILIPDNYQARLVFLSYDGQGTYKVMHRTHSTNGKIVIDDNLFGTYEYLAFNLSTIPNSDLSEQLEQLKDVIQFVNLEPTSDTMTFKLGYWNNNSARIDSVSANHVNFVATNVLSKDFVGVDTTIVIEEGYQIRVVFIHVEYNVPVVLLRTDNLTGTVVLDETMWGTYEYVAFNISKVTTENISEEVELTGSKITLNKVPS